MNNKIILIAGDPNSINSEIIFKVWKKLDNRTKKNIYLIGNFNLFSKQFKILNYKIKMIKVADIMNKNETNDLKIIDIPINFKNPFKVNLKEASNYVLKSLNLAHSFIENKHARAIINCPINKKLIQTSKKIGVTEFFASKCKIKDSSEVMFIHNKKFSVVPLTTHLDIKNVSKNISSNIINKKLTTLNNEFKKIFKFKPKIGILGLNPHNSELKKNSEEVKTIIPSILILRRKGLKIEGPLVADTLFINNYKNYDVVVGMYHDQVLAPFKTLFNFDAINITLGLNYLRVSPDHGPGLDLIGKNKANFYSLYQCVKFITSKI
jgi:4-hydroxythreonine-4-phosphate dehydrogenase